MNNLAPSGVGSLPPTPSLARASVADPAPPPAAEVEAPRAWRGLPALAGMAPGAFALAALAIYLAAFLTLSREAGPGLWAAGMSGLVLLGLGVVRFRALDAQYRSQLAARDEAERRLRESEERYALAARGANDGLWDWDLRSNAMFLSARGRALLGDAPDERRTTVAEWAANIHPEDLPRVRAELRAHLAGETPQFWLEYRIRHRDGGYLWVLARGVAVRDATGRAYRMAGSLTDISDQKRAEEQLRHQALHDALTGLPNRALFLDRLQQCLARSQRGERTFAVLFLDLDRFKLVNDSLGHLAGDDLLRAAARLLRGQLGEGDTVARLGGDEFAILVEDLAVPSEATRTAERLVRALRTPFQLGTQEVFTSASIGVVLGSEAYTRPEEMLRDADTAMYRAKALGRGCVQLFTASLHASAKETLQLDAAMRRGLERDEFLVHYQPIVSLAEGRITGVEALVRWQHPERGLVMPGAFIPVAEETGLIVPLGSRVLREACRQVRAWQALRPGAPPLQLCVNLSARQLAQGSMVDTLARILAETGLPASQLKLEVTESVVMEDMERTGHVLAELRALGVSLSMDDFGTGYSSLSCLHQFPLQTLKVDRSFVWRLAEGERSREIVRTIVGLAHSLGLDVVAEGVETPAQLEALREMGCESVQGYLLARPLDVERAEALLRADPRW